VRVVRRSSELAADLGQQRKGEAPPIMFGVGVVLALIQVAEQIGDDLRALAP
jgi:hypothetical protein